MVEDLSIPRFRVVGTNVERDDGACKVRGAATYTDDLRLPYMLYGKILRSPFPHAKIHRIDTTKAERIIGVRVIITAEQMTPVSERSSQYEKFSGRQRIFADQKVRFAGEELAAVAATSADTAEEALEAIQVEYEELPCVFEIEDALKPEAPLLYEENKGNIAQHFEFARGDIQKGFSQAKFIVEDRFVSQNAHQGYLEPLACICEYDRDGRLTVWCGTMFPSGVRQNLSRALGLPERKIRVLQMAVGGAFGGKMTTRPLFPICGLLAMRTGRPVKIACTQEEEFSAGRPRESTVIYMKIGVREDGIITARDTKMIYEAGAYALMSPIMHRISAVRSDALYRYSNLRTEGILVYTNKPPVGAYRGFGNPEMTFAVETLLDTLASKLAIDPAEIRLRNATQQGDTTVHGWKINSCGLSECVKKATESTEWAKKRLHAKPNRGIGMACMIHIANPQQSGFSGSTAYVRILEDGTLQIITGEAEYGQGTNTSYRIIAAEEFGVDYKDVELVPIDTDIAPYSLSAFGTRVMMVGGNAVRLAAADAKRQLLEFASNELEANVDDLEIRQGWVRIKGSPERGASVTDLARLRILRDGEMIIGKGVQRDHHYTMHDAREFDPKGNVASAYYFDALVAEVEVDPETGRINVLEITEALDCGRIINRLGLEGQVDGGVAQGMGYALMENCYAGEKWARNSSFLDYKFPTALDVPKIKRIFIESVEPAGPFGAKGAGESAGAVSAAAAIANAVYHVTGVRMRELPITEEALGK